jgi:hypothetical protein
MRPPYRWARLASAHSYNSFFLVPKAIDCHTLRFYIIHITRKMNKRLVGFGQQVFWIYLYDLHSTIYIELQQTDNTKAISRIRQPFSLLFGQMKGRKVGKESSRTNWSYMSSNEHSCNVFDHFRSPDFISAYYFWNCRCNGVCLDVAFGETFPRTFKAFIRCSSFPTIYISVLLCAAPMLHSWKRKHSLLC